MGALPDYAELHCLSNFSFLRGASHPEEIAIAAAALGLAGFALTDRNSLAGTPPPPHLTPPPCDE